MPSSRHVRCGSGSGKAVAVQRDAWKEGWCNSMTRLAVQVTGNSITSGLHTVSIRLISLYQRKHGGLRCRLLLVYAVPGTQSVWCWSPNSMNSARHAPCHHPPATGVDFKIRRTKPSKLSVYGLTLKNMMLVRSHVGCSADGCMRITTSPTCCSTHIHHTQSRRMPWFSTVCRQL